MRGLLMGSILILRSSIKLLKYGMLRLESSSILYRIKIMLGLLTGLMMAGLLLQQLLIRIMVVTANILFMCGMQRQSNWFVHTTVIMMEWQLWRGHQLDIASPPLVATSQLEMEIRLY